MGLLSGATFGTSGSFASSLIAAGWTPAAAVAARVLLAALVLTVPALLHVRAQHATWASVRTIALYGVIAVAGAQLCYFNAVSHLSVGVALLLEYSGILLVVGWEWLRHGHRPARLTVVGGAAAVAGLVLVLDLTGSHRLDAVGVLWGLGAAVGLAAYFILSAERDGSVPPLVMAWGGLVVGGMVLAVAGLSGLLPLHAAFTAVTLLGRQVSWILPVLGLALIAAVIAYVAGIAAVRLLGSKLASFVGLTEVLFAVVFAWLLLGQRLDATQLAGGALVVAGIALVRLDEMGHPTTPTPPRRAREQKLLPADAVGTGA
ncbi:MAG: DMT family transporter [Candidatus Dormiibacterota bacterium]